MHVMELFFLAVGLSMDAFAVAVCIGLPMPSVPPKKSLIVGLYFGGFQAGMPLIGYWIATLFAEKIIAYDHWVAFALLCFLGGKMIVGSFQKTECPDRECPGKACGGRARPRGVRPGSHEASLRPAAMLPLALATSVDALAIGVSFAFFRVSIVPAAAFIGLTTLVISMAGVKIGSAFGSRFKSRAELAGGVILVLVGLRILLDHVAL